MQAWVIRYGRTTRYFFTAYHANQYMRALELNGTEFNLTQANLARG